MRRKAVPVVLVVLQDVPVPGDDVVALRVLFVRRQLQGRLVVQARGLRPGNELVVGI
jgi:hypothetical protein